jgi:enamine deaminase RidA (YjgF/YER057c/UK114 family)
VARLFQNAATLLAQEGMTYEQVSRTWIYIADIVDWYNDFNRARNDVYHEFGLMPDTSKSPIQKAVCKLPASTGIEGYNLPGAALWVDLTANIGPTPVRRLTNIRQKDAFRYGAAFARGTVIELPDCKIVQISGTAAIDETGVSLFPGNSTAQIERTLDNIDALLAQVDGNLSHVISSTHFLKYRQDVPVLKNILQQRGLSQIPGVGVIADVCRDDLLFELDGVACIPNH